MMDNKKLIPTWLIIIILIVSFFGLLDSSYLTAKHFLGEVPPCSLITGCEDVTTSQYSEIFGIPVALLGAIYYLLVFILALVYFDTRNLKAIKLIPSLTIVGFSASIYFVFLQLFVIKAICLYCMGSALTSTLLFISGIVIWNRLHLYKNL